jgi:hypothetical protein
MPERFKKTWKDEQDRRFESHSEFFIPNLKEHELYSQEGLQSINRLIEIDQEAHVNSQNYDIEMPLVNRQDHLLNHTPLVNRRNPNQNYLLKPPVNWLHPLQNDLLNMPLVNRHNPNISMQDMKQKQSPLDALVWRRDAALFKKQFKNKTRFILNQKRRYEKKQMEETPEPKAQEPPKKKQRFNEEPLDIKNILAFQNEMKESDFGMDPCFDTTLYPDSPMYDAIQHGVELIGAGRNPKLFKMGTYADPKNTQGGAKANPTYQQRRLKAVAKAEKAKAKRLLEESQQVVIGSQQSNTWNRNLGKVRDPNQFGEIPSEWRKPIPQAEGEDLTTLTSSVSVSLANRRHFTPTIVVPPTPIILPSDAIQQVQRQINPQLYIPEAELYSQPEPSGSPWTPALTPPPVPRFQPQIPTPKPPRILPSIAIQAPPLIPLTFRSTTNAPSFAPPPAPKLRGITEEEFYGPPPPAPRLGPQATPIFRERSSSVPIPPTPKFTKPLPEEDIDEFVDEFDEEIDVPTIDVQAAVDEYKRKTRTPPPFLPPTEDPFAALEEGLEPLEIEEAVVDFDRPYMTHVKVAEDSLMERLKIEEGIKQLRLVDEEFENNVVPAFHHLISSAPNVNLFILAVNAYARWLDQSLMPYLEKRKRSYKQTQSKMKAIKEEADPHHRWNHWLLTAALFMKHSSDRLNLDDESFDRVKYAIDNIDTWVEKISVLNKELKAKVDTSKFQDRMDLEEAENRRRREIGHRNELTEGEIKQAANSSYRLTVKTGVLQDMRIIHQQDALNSIAESCYRIREKQIRPGKRNLIQCELLFSFRGLTIGPEEDAAQTISATLGATWIDNGNIKFKYQSLLEQEIKHWSYRKWQITFLLYIKHHDDQDRVHIIQKRTSQNGSYQATLNEAIEIIEQLSNNYENDVIMIKDFYIAVITQRPITEEEKEFGIKELPDRQVESALIGGTYYQIEKKLSYFKDEYFIVNPNARTNCLWVAYVIGKRWNQLYFDYQLDSSSHSFPGMIHTLTDIQNQKKQGCKLKKRIEAQFKNFGTEKDLENLAAEEKQWIIVKDSTGDILREFNPPELTEGEKKKIKSKKMKGSKKLKRRQIPIQLLLAYHHYHTLIPKYQIPFTVQQKIKEKDEVKEVDSGKHNIIRCENSKDKDLGKIVCYDLESYQQMGETEQEIEQIAYAVGWCFLIETAEEETYVETKEDDFDVEEFEMNEKTVRVAFRRLLGEASLDQALHEWMHEPIYNGCSLYAHNGGKFDLRLILGQSDLCFNEKYLIYHEDLIELNGRFLNMTVYNIQEEEGDTKTNHEEDKIDLKEKHTVHFKDSLPLFGVGNSLANLCKEFDVQHKKLEEKIGIHEKMFQDTWRELWEQEELDKYLKNDCIGLLEVLLKFEQECFQATNIHITEVNTGASLARKYYLKKMYNDSEFNGCIFTLKKNEDEFVRQSFAGGRVENFISRSTTEKLYYYDFTSLYPDVACLNLPCGKPLYVIPPEKLRNPSLKLENQQRLDHVFYTRVYQNNIGFMEKCFWKVRVACFFKDAAHPDRQVEINDILKNRKPLFGVKNVITKNMLLFPWLETVHETDWEQHGVELTLYEEEIKEAVKLKLPYHFYPIQGLMFRSKPLLKDAMENLFKMKADAKKDNKPALSKLWKIVINSLYGVWGIRKFGREGLEIATSYNSNWCMNFMKDKLIDMNNIGNYIVTRILKDLPTNKCNVAIASAITSEARLKLYRLMWDIQTAGGKVYYCDTDSIITNYCLEDDDRLNAKWIGTSKGERLGSLKNEIDECYDKYLKKYPSQTQAIMELDKHCQLRRKRYFDNSIIVAPKMYMVTAEGGKIVKKAHKGFKENQDKGDIVTFARMNTMVDESKCQEQRIMEQDMIQWRGANGEFMNDKPIGVTLVKIHKQIRATINKGTLDPRTRDIIAFRNLEQVTEDIQLKQQQMNKRNERRKIDETLEQIILQLSPERADILQEAKDRMELD